MASIRSVMGRNHTLPDPEMDVSGFMLASMQIGVKSVSWEMVQAELHKDTEFKDLSDWISGGCIGPPESLPDYLKQYWRVRHDLRLLEEVPMLSDRTVIPRGLRVPVLQTLHSAHQGVLGMGLRAEQAVYWPGFWSDIERVRAECSMCHKIAPSQSNLPPVEPIIPNYPFEHVCVDYMSLDGMSYGVFVDRYTGWPGVYKGDKSLDVTTFLARLCEDYGVPVSCTSDGAPNLTSQEVENMMQAYGIHHRISSVANPHANSRAELGVKTVKRMLRENVSSTGQLDRAKFSRALLQLRNTPDRDTRMSPAVALFGRHLRDFLPRHNETLMGDMWTKLADARETALARRSTDAREKWSANTKSLKPLLEGDSVFVQNQTGNHPKRWDKRGVVIKVNDYDQYMVRLDGSRRLTRRNRKFLRKFEPFRPVRPFNTTAGGQEQHDQTVQSQAPVQSPARQVQVQTPARQVQVQTTARQVPIQSPVQTPARQVPIQRPARQVPVQTPACHVQAQTPAHQIPVQRKQQVQDQRVQSWDNMEQHEGFDYQPMSACPPIGGNFNDFMHWMIPTQSQPADASQEGAQQEGQRGDQGRDRSPAQEIRRSTRSGRGQTTKYQDYVESVSCRNIYEQKWPVLGGGRASL
jgi:hypothetical protein